MHLRAWRGWYLLIIGTVTAGLLGLAWGRPAAAFEPDALMLRRPDVSATQLVFTYDYNLWVAPKTGGMAVPLTSAPGSEGGAKFSTDGASIAYIANYDGASEVYIIDTAGGVPRRLTWSPRGKFLTGFAPDGGVVYGVWSELPHGQTLLYQVSPQGGAPARLPLANAAFNSFSADGQWLAFCPWTREYDTWNRYMGGTASDIWLFNLQTHESRQITDWGGTDDLPMIDGDRVFYLSDAGPEHRRNIWVYNIKDGSRAQVTHFTEHETKWPSIGPQEIALENGGALYLLGLQDLALREVHIALPGDRPHLRPYALDPGANLMAISLSPHGQRVAASLRGDVWTFPAQHGFPQALTRSDGSAERDPAWSPDGKWIAYFSDVAGEYDLYQRLADGSGPEQRLTSNADCFRYDPRFSPDGKKISFCDKTGTDWIYLLETQETVKVDTDPWGGAGISAVWARDSNWLAYTTSDATTGLSVIKLYSLKDRQSWPVTSPLFSSGEPVFDLSGDYLYFSTNRRFETSYSEVGDWGEFYFTNTGVLALLPLRNDVPSPWAPKNDVDKADTDAAEAGVKPEAGAEKVDGAVADQGKDKEADKEKAASSEPLKIDLEGIEGRAVLIPVDSGNYGNLAGGLHKLFYIRAPRSGASGGEPAWCVYDFGGDEPKETQLLAGVNSFELTLDATKALLSAPGGYFITGTEPEVALDKPVNLGGLSVTVDPRTEWRQIVIDAWRTYRDYFYDPGMHGVDWNAVQTRSLKLVDSAANRADVNYIISEMVSDINSSHTYIWGGDEAGAPGLAYGLLGCDFELTQDENNVPGWRISKILHGAPWELDARSPLDLPGVQVQPGAFLLAVNGKPVDQAQGPYAVLYGTADRPTELLLCAKAAPDGSERKILVTPLGDDSELRLRCWIEETRQYVYSNSDGKLGYIYVRNTEDAGAADFERQFLGQHELAGLIVDERWNGGGYSPDPIIAILARQPRNYWATRDGHSWRTPWLCHPGPKLLLANEHAGSGGDSFPWLWRKYGLGPIVGTRTWGGLIGISGNPELIDGSGLTVPTFGIFDLDGTWAVEGHGIDPDVPVVNDPTSLARGQDKQVDTAIELLLKEVAAHPYVAPDKPPYPDRSGMGVLEKDR